MHVETYPAFLTPRDKRLSLSSSEEKSSEFGWLEIKRNEKWKMKEKEKQSKALYILYIDRSDYIYDLWWFYSGCKGIYIETFFQLSSLRNLMVGGLQGEEWKFIQKYLKKRSKRVGAQISGSTKDISQVKMVSARFRRHSRGLRNIFATTS